MKNLEMNTKKAPLAAILTLAVGAALVALPTACSTDPAYEAVRNRIPDTEYPATQIVGQWMNFIKEPGVLAIYHEIKDYIDLRPDGTGQRRIVTSVGSKTSEDLTMNLSWRYLGKNRWSVAVLRDSVRTNVAMPPRRRSYSGLETTGITSISENRWFRFLSPRLYDTWRSISYVPLDSDGLVRAIHQEQRGQQ
jgi:hypothetical protein